MGKYERMTILWQFWFHSPNNCFYCILFYKLSQKFPKMVELQKAQWYLVAHHYPFWGSSSISDTMDAITKKWLLEWMERRQLFLKKHFLRLKSLLRRELCCNSCFILGVVGIPRILYWVRTHVCRELNTSTDLKRSMGLSWLWYPSRSLMS